MPDIVKLVREAKAGKLRPERDDDFDLTEQEREEGGRKYTGAQLVTLRSRAAAALKIHGTSYEEIADILEYESIPAARVAVESAIASTVDETKDYEALRGVATLRLEALLKSVMPRALDDKHLDHLAYVRTASGLLERLSALHGLNAPQRVQMVNPDAQEFEKTITIVMEASRSGEPRESDPFALESAPDGAEMGPEDADA